ncbi:MAG: hypothetical protein DRO99_00870 [Candidatus Aenigmatarchaeota archaeon]|nr:MAG: hypothetical protein DRO99_00870 [Candidatus Aenigmarchaeota archaeon]
MDWKRFLKPQVSKVAVFIVLIFMFGLPANVKLCNAYIQPVAIGETAPPQCGDVHIEFQNPLVNPNLFILDASYSIDYSPMLFVPYLVLLYLGLSLISHAAGYDWKKALLYLIAVLFMVALAAVTASTALTASF